MSHFTVLVIGETPKEQIAPYDENIEVPEYVTQELTDEDKRRMVKYYHEKKPETINYGFEKLYSMFGKGWNSNCWRKNSLGVWIETSTYNPKSKWDWYKLGGRWTGIFKLKKNKVGRAGKPGLMTDPAKKGFVDQARKGDINFSPDVKSFNEAIRFWELIVEEKELKKGEKKPFTTYKKEWYPKRYKTKENFAKQRAEFRAFAVVKNGEWHEQGKMGWFGCSSDTPEEAQEWDRSFFSKWIEPLPNNTLLSVFDCHI